MSGKSSAADGARGPSRDRRFRSPPSRIDAPFRDEMVPASGPAARIIDARRHRAPRAARRHPDVTSMRPASPLLCLLALVTACATPDLPTAPAPRAAVVAPPPIGDFLPRPVVRLALERAADGLLYTSESDYPFVYYSHAGPVRAPLTIATFRAALAIPAESPVEAITIDEFFARHIERVDPADPVAVALVPRYVTLRETIRQAVRDPLVFRVGRIAIHCYVVGTDRYGDVVGLTTIAIET